MATGGPLDDGAPIGSALEAAAREMKALAALGEQLQRHISPLLVGAAVSTEVQRLDEFVQRAEGVQSFLERLAQACVVEWRVPQRGAARQIRLAAQQRRLAGVHDDCALDLQGSIGSAGEMELF